MSIGAGKRAYVYGRTRLEVAQKLRDALKRQDDGEPVAASKETVGTYLIGWLVGVKPSLRPGTHLRYQQLVTQHVLPKHGTLPLKGFTAAHVQRVIAAMLDAGLAPSTARQTRAILHKALKQAVQRGLVARNVVDGAPAPRVERREMKSLNAEQAMRLMDAAQSEPLGALYVLGVSSGLRLGELLGLRWADVDLERRTLGVNVTLQRVGREYVLAAPKTKQSRRLVTLPAVAVEALRRHRTQQNADRLRLGGAWLHPEMVFTTELGDYVNGTNLRHTFNPMLKRAGLPRIRIHDLRHSAATLMMANGVHPKVVSEMLGHANIAITMDTYSHVGESMKRQASDALDSVFSTAR
jgi:integrase